MFHPLTYGDYSPGVHPVEGTLTVLAGRQNLDIAVGRRHKQQLLAPPNRHPLKIKMGDMHMGGMHMHRVSTVGKMHNVPGNIQSDCRTRSADY